MVSWNPSISDADLETSGTIIGLLGYFMALWVFNSRGESVGKRALGMRIIQAGGSSPGPWLGLGRTAGMLVSGLFFGVGYWSASFQEERRTFHDKMAGTWVVRRP